MNKKMINEVIKAFEFCKTVIKVLHPILDPDEPCIAYEACEEADHQITRLRNLTGVSNSCECEEPDCYIWYGEKYCAKCSLMCI